MSKQNFNEKLIALLKTNPDFTDESDELLTAAVKDHAWKLDHYLIKLLLSDPEIRGCWLNNDAKIKEKPSESPHILFYYRFYYR